MFSVYFTLLSIHIISHSFIERSQSNLLKTQLRATPVSALCVPLNSVIGSQTNPVRQRAILPLLLGKRTLGTECFLGRLWYQRNE